MASLGTSSNRWNSVYAANVDTTGNIQGVGANGGYMLLPGHTTNEALRIDGLDTSGVWQNNLILGYTSGNVNIPHSLGVGNVVPTEKLHVNGNALADEYHVKADSNGSQAIMRSRGIKHVAGTTNTWQVGIYAFQNNGSTGISSMGIYGQQNTLLYTWFGGSNISDYANQLRLWNNGVFSIGVQSQPSATTYKLMVTGKAVSNGWVTTSSSDRRLKTDITDASDCCDRLSRLGKVRRFRYVPTAKALDKDIDLTHLYTGVIWQEAKGTDIADFVLPEQNGYGAVNYLSSDFQATMLGAVQELTAKTKEQQKTIEEQQEEIEELKEMVRKLMEKLK